jgi:hypothetical protein
MPGGLRVLVVGEPPAADKIAAELGTYPGVAVTYARSRHKHAITGLAVEGMDYLVAMNLHGQGAVVKERCRKAGVKYVTVGPSWSAAKLALEQAGFFKVLERAPFAAPAPLMQRPFAAAARRAGLHSVVDQIAERAKAGDTKVVAALTKAWGEGHGRPDPVIATRTVREASPVVALPRGATRTPGDLLRDPPPSLRAAPEAPPPAPAAEGTAPEAPSTSQAPRTATPAPGDVLPHPPEAPQASQEVPESRKGGITQAARERGVASRSGASADRLAFAEALFTAGPDLDAVEVNRQIAVRFGVGLNSDALYRIRREVRARLNLPPAPGTRGKYRIEPQPTSAPMTASPAPASGTALPAAVLTAQAALVAALRTAGFVSSYTLTYLSGEAEVEHEVEVRRTEKGKQSL